MRGLNLVELGHRDGLSLDPTVNLPEPGIVVGRAALRDGGGTADSTNRGQLRQPFEFSTPWFRWPLATGEPNREPIAEPKNGIDGAAGLDSAERQVGPLRELAGDEAMRERLV